MRSIATHKSSLALSLSLYVLEDVYVGGRRRGWCAVIRIVGYMSWPFCWASKGSAVNWPIAAAARKWANSGRGLGIKQEKGCVCYSRILEEIWGIRGFWWVGFLIDKLIIVDESSIWKVMDEIWHHNKTVFMVVVGHLIGLYRIYLGLQNQICVNFQDWILEFEYLTLNN